MTTWVFLRGLVRERRHWGKFPADFQRECPDADIVTLDLPGNGAADSPPIKVIPIPFSANGTTPGYRVAIFDAWNEACGRPWRGVVDIEKELRR